MVMLADYLQSAEESKAAPKKTAETKPAGQTRYLADWLAESETPAKPTGGKETGQSAKGGKPKSAQQEGIEDLKQVIGQLEDSLADTKPDSPTHKRISASLAEAKKELAKYGMQPAETLPAVAPVAAPAPSNVKQVASRNLRAASDLEVPTPAAMEAERQRGQQARAATAKKIEEASVLQKYGAPLLEVPLAVATALPGLVYQQATGKYGGYEPRSPVSQEILGGLTSALEASKLEGLTGAPILRPSAAVTAERLGVKPPVSTAARIEPVLEKPRITLEEFRAQQARPKLSEAEAQAQFAERQGMAGVGAAKADIKSRINEIAQRLPMQEAQKLLSADPKKVDLEAAERRAKAHKFDIDLTLGEAKQNRSLLGDEFNAKKELPELQNRFDVRNGRLFKGLDDIKERTAPDVYTSNKVDLGQKIIDAILEKDAVRKQNISNLYKQLEEANAGSLPIDTQSLLTNINKELRKKMRSRYAPAELMGTIEEAVQRGSMTFEEFENLRTIAAEEIRNSKDGNRRLAAGIIRDQLENMPLSTSNAEIKKLADQARDAAKERFDILKKNPAYKAAVGDSRDLDDIAKGLESVAADKFLDKFVHADTQQAATANVARLISELNDLPEALQALRAGTVEHLREKSLRSGDYFGQAGYNKRMAALQKKLDRIFANDPALQDLRDLGEVASWTEHVKPGSGANVSESANVMRQLGVGAAELAGTAMGAPTVVTTGIRMAGKGKEFFAGRKRQTQLREMVEPGAGIIRGKNE